MKFPTHPSTQPQHTLANNTPYCPQMRRSTGIFGTGSKPTPSLFSSSHSSKSTPSRKLINRRSASKLDLRVLMDKVQFLCQLDRLPLTVFKFALDYISHVLYTPGLEFAYQQVFQNRLNSFYALNAIWIG